MGVVIYYSAIPRDAEDKSKVLPRYIEASGLSTDDKPTEACTGSIFCEVDTGKIFFFNGESGEWVEQFSFQS